MRGWDGWHRHVALALLASAFRACLRAEPLDASEADAAVDPLLPFAEPVVLHPADAAASDEAHAAAGDEDGTTAADEAELIPFPPLAGPTIYRLLVDLLDTDWRPVRAFQTWLVASEAGTVLDSTPSRAEIGMMQVGVTPSPRR